MAQKTDVISKSLAALIEERGEEAVSAAAKAIGVKLSDIRGLKEEDVNVSELVPADKVPQMREKKEYLFNELRQHRLDQLKERLKEMKPDEVKRFAKVGEGVSSLPFTNIEVGELQGMADFKEKAQKMMKKQKIEQERKANALVNDFLTSKKAAEDADARAAALEQRLQDFKKAQRDFYDNRKKELQKQADKRAAGAAAAAKAREEYEQKCLDDQEFRLNRARTTRAETYNVDKLKGQAEESAKKRAYVFNQAVKAEKELQAEITDKMTRLDYRLQERNKQVAEDLRLKAEAMQQKFHSMQDSVARLRAQELATRLEEHEKFDNHFESCRTNNKNFLDTRSKSLGDLRKKAYNKWSTNHQRIHDEHVAGNNAIMERHQAGIDRCEELRKMRIKNGNDIFSYQEVKHRTFDVLNKKNREALKRAQDAETQQCVIHLAERFAVKEAQKAGVRKQAAYKQSVFAETLKTQDHAREVFLRIQSEGDLSKIEKAMAEIGLELPKEPKKDGEEEKKEGF